MTRKRSRHKGRRSSRGHKRSGHKHRGYKRSTAGKASSSSSSSSSNTLGRLHDLLAHALTTIEAEEDMILPEESIKCHQLRDQFNDLKNKLVQMETELRRVCKPIPPRHPRTSRRGRGTKKKSSS